MMHAAADVTFSLLTSGLVLSPSLFFPWIQFIRFVQFVLRVRLLLDWSCLATVRDVSSGTHHVINPSRPYPCFSYCKQQKLGMEAWGRGYPPSRFCVRIHSIIHFQISCHLRSSLTRVTISCSVYHSFTTLRHEPQYCGSLPVSCANSTGSNLHGVVLVCQAIPI